MRSRLTFSSLLFVAAAAAVVVVVVVVVAAVVPFRFVFHSILILQLPCEVHMRGV